MPTNAERSGFSSPHPAFSSPTLVAGFLFGWTTTFDTDPTLPAGQCAYGCTDAMRGDGHCDAACMSAACGWDSKRAGGESDCSKECDPGCQLQQLGNGVCEPSCASEACGYDAADCSCSRVMSECDGAATDGSERTAHYNNIQSICWLIEVIAHP